MTTVSLEDVKKVDQRSKDCVFGYIRRIQSIFPDHIYFTISPLITHWIILYYYVWEQFDDNLCAKDKYILSENNTIVTQNDEEGPGNAFLKNIAKFGVHR